MKTEELNGLILNLYGSAQECTVSEFHEQALLLTKQIVKFDSAVVVGASFAKDEAMTVETLHGYNQPIEKLYERKNLSSPDTVLTEALRNKGICKFEDARNIDKKHTDLIEYCKKYEVAHTLILISPSSSNKRMDLVALWRAKSKNAYTSSDSKFGNIILPHLFQAKAINSKICAGKQLNSYISSISLISRLDGCLQFVDESTIQLFQNEWTEWTPPMLPSEFIDELRRHNFHQYVGRTFAANATIHDNLLYIQLRPKPIVPRLTKAEQEVAWMASKGMTYKEIAKQLGTSPATVRNQLHAIYTKLDVSNKTSLATTLSSLANIYPPKSS